MWSSNISFPVREVAFSWESLPSRGTAFCHELAARDDGCDSGAARGSTGRLLCRGFVFGYCEIGGHSRPQCFPVEVSSFLKKAVEVASSPRSGRYVRRRRDSGVPVSSLPAICFQSTPMSLTGVPAVVVRMVTEALPEARSARSYGREPGIKPCVCRCTGPCPPPLREREHYPIPTTALLVLYEVNAPAGGVVQTRVDSWHLPCLQGGHVARVATLPSQAVKQSNTHVEQGKG